MDLGLQVRITKQGWSGSLHPSQTSTPVEQARLECSYLKLFSRILPTPD